LARVRKLAKWVKKYPEMTMEDKWLAELVCFAKGRKLAMGVERCAGMKI
jgi:hypothetical protein